jgi:hypothetical protein
MHADMLSIIQRNTVRLQADLYHRSALRYVIYMLNKYCKISSFLFGKYLL